MLIIGHRGARGLVSENTLGSFKKAQKLKVDMIETDLRLNKSGEIVLSHNRLGKNGFHTSLAELLAEARVPLNLEVKESGFESQLLQQIKKFPYKVLISSFQVKILKKIRALDGNIQLGLNLGNRNISLVLPRFSFLDKKLNFFSVHLRNNIARRILIQRLKRRGKQVYVFTVNDLERFEELKQMHVDGVFTDYPNIIKNHD